MKKIKNFKVNIRESQVLRLLKKTSLIAEITPQIEDAIKQEKIKREKGFQPAAIYDTFTKEKLDFDNTIANAKNLVAFSAFLVAIERSIVDEINDLQRRGEGILSKILHAMAVEALEQSVNFVIKLLGEEARDENCLLGEKKAYSTGTEVEKISVLLPFDKINIRYVGGNFDPVYAVCGFVPWFVQKKSGK